MDQEPLVIEQIDAGAIFLGEFAKTVAVAAAFWLKVGEESPWYLYVVSDEFNDKNLDIAYGEVLRIAGELHHPYFDPFKVKLIEQSYPLAQAALEVNRRFPGKIPTRFGSGIFGGMGVEGAYIYPSSVTSPTAVSP
jgi:hypothetical protein